MFAALQSRYVSVIFRVCACYKACIKCVCVCDRGSTRELVVVVVGGFLRRGLVGGGFSAISAGDTMKVTRQKDLIAPVSSLAVWGQFLSPAPRTRLSVSQQFNAAVPTFLSPSPFSFIPPPPRWVGRGGRGGGC